jgi:uroporphyrinogen III methyltransferase / synthase
MGGPDGPLAGARVVVTRPSENARELATRLTVLGAEVLIAPAIRIVDPESWDDLDNAIKRIAAGEYVWTLFASGHAVRRLFSRVEVAGWDRRCLEATRVAVVGSATARVLGDFGVKAELIPERFEGRALVSALGLGTGRVLLPRVQGGPRAIVDELEELGWKVDEVVAYRNLPEAPDSPAFQSIRAGGFDVVTFTSPSAVVNFSKALSPPSIGINSGGGSSRQVVCIGPATAAAARAQGLRVDAVARVHNLDGLVDAVCALREVAR